MSKDNEGFIQSGELPTDRAPAVLNRAYCKGWHDAITNVIQHLQSQMGVWRDGDIALEHLFKHLQGNVRSLQIDPPPSLFEAEQGGDPQHPVEDAVDARRYRWLRDVASKLKEPWGLYRPKMTYRLDEDCYDSAIDAAMSAQSDTEESK